jgi:phosphoribosylformylglycinamidine synthase
MDCWLRVERTDTVYTNRYVKGSIFRAVMAHGEGNYFADDTTLTRLEHEGLVAFRYTGPAGDMTEEANPNGSARSIAGVFSPNRRILGMMPHAENLVDPLMGGDGGRNLFDSLMAT